MYLNGLGCVDKVGFTQRISLFLKDLLKVDLLLSCGK